MAWESSKLEMSRMGRCAKLAWEHAVEARSAAAFERMRPAIMTGHILLGVLTEPTCAGGLILRKMGLDLELAADTTRFVLFYGRHPKERDAEIVDWNGEPHTHEARQVLEYSLDEANLFYATYPIGTEHLLLGLTRVESGMGCNLLRHFGITHHETRAARDTFWDILKLSE